MRRAQIGSVYKTIGSGAGIALQLIGRHNVVGDIARVCKLDDRKSDICAAIETIFIIGFPFSAAIKDGYLKYMTECEVPLNLTEIKFRFPNINQKGGVASWTILSNEGQEIVKSLDREQLKYPLAYAVNVQKLEELIAINWDGKGVIS